MTPLAACWSPFAARAEPMRIHEAMTEECIRGVAAAIAKMARHYAA